MLLGLKDNLEYEQYEVTVANDGQKGLDIILSQSFELILLDIMIPKVSGFDICKSARKYGITTPIIFLTAKGEEIDKVLGLELGADDYITKPFSVRELMARIKAVLRRYSDNPVKEQPSDVLQLGKLSLDFAHYEAHDAEKNKIKLSHKEFEILAYLYNHKNEVVSRYKLLEDVWGYEAQPTTRTVDNFILKLRQKIEENPNDPKFILTVHGAGYKMLI